MKLKYGYLEPSSIYRSELMSTGRVFLKCKANQQNLCYFARMQGYKRIHDRFSPQQLWSDKNKRLQSRRIQITKERLDKSRSTTRVATFQELASEMQLKCKHSTRVTWHVRWKTQTSIEHMCTCVKNIGASFPVGLLLQPSAFALSPFGRLEGGNKDALLFSNITKRMTNCDNHCDDTIDNKGKIA